MKVWIDTDVGGDIDDALTLLLALASPEVELVGVSTVFENTLARAEIAKTLLSMGGRPEVPVYAGEGLPLRALQPQLFKGLVPDGAFPHRGGGDVPQALGIGAGQQAFQISHHASSFFKVFRSFSRPRFRRLFTVEGFMPSSSAMRATVCRQ